MYDSFFYKDRAPKSEILTQTFKKLYKKIHMYLRHFYIYFYILFVFLNIRFITLDLYYYHLDHVAIVRYYTTQYLY